MPMSGKDTVGRELAKMLDAVFLSSGAILREAEENHECDPSTATGFLTPTDTFFKIVLPYFKKPELENRPLVLSSIGRWDGEENHVLASLKEARHETKAVIILNLPETVALFRRETALELGDRGLRGDDADPKVFERRLQEYREKTLPVLEHYKKLGLAVEIDADQSREKVLSDVVVALANLAKKS